MDIGRIEKALDRVAAFVADDARYLPLFEHLEGELAAARSKNEAMERARRMARQNEMGLSKAAA